MSLQIQLSYGQIQGDVFPFVSRLYEEGSIERIQFEKRYFKRFSLIRPGNVL